MTVTASRNSTLLTKEPSSGYINKPALSQQLKPPKRIYLLGERNSGTKFIESVLRTAFFPKYSNLPPKPTPEMKKRRGSYPFASFIPIFDFNHLFRHSLLSEEELKQVQQLDDILWIFAMRSPCDWADGMYRKAWHLCIPVSKCPGPYIGNVKSLPSKMTRTECWNNTEWGDYSESRRTPNAFVYKNVFELREHKLQIMKQMQQRVPHRVHIAHLQTVERSPEMFVKGLVKQFGLEQNVEARQINNSVAKMHNNVCLNWDEFTVAHQEINWEMEGYFGFGPHECHVCR